MKSAFLLLLAFAIFGFAAPVDATLIDRGGGLIYDTDFNITWLQDANYAMTSGYDADGRMTWTQAMIWSQNLIFGGYDDWRLPSPLNQDGTVLCGSWGCSESEMGHLYLVELNNAMHGPLSNTGPFINLQSYAYWTNREYPLLSSADYFYLPTGFSGTSYKESYYYYALAVRDGDVAAVAATAVPEPFTLLLLGSGLAGLGLMGWRKRREKGNRKTA